MDFAYLCNEFNLNFMKKALDILSFLFILANVVISCVFYFTTDIPIPAHFSTYENMKTYGQTWMILVLSGISLLIYLLMVLSERHHEVNLPFKVKDKPSAQPFIDKMLAWTNALVMLVLLYVDIAVAQYIPFSQAIVFLIILVIVIVDFYFTRKIYRCGRK